MGRSRHLGIVRTTLSSDRIDEIDEARCRKLLDRAGDTVDRVFANIEETRRVLVGRLLGVHRAGRRPSRADFAVVGPAVQTQLRQSRGLMAGAGAIAAPGLLSDASRWLEWWTFDRGDEPRFLTVELDPQNIDFYEYEAAGWFVREREQRTVVGPYIDASGTDERILR